MKKKKIGREIKLSESLNYLIEKLKWAVVNDLEIKRGRKGDLGIIKNKSLTMKSV